MDTSPNPASPTFVIVLDGDVDIARRPLLQQHVRDFRASRSTDVDIDLSRVEFLDSTGLAAIFRLRRIAVARGGRVRLLSPSRPVRRILEVSGAGDLVDIVTAP